MNRSLLSSALGVAGLTALLVACGGADGAAGAPGKDGAQGAAGAAGKPGDSAKVEPTVSFVTPSKAVLDREIDVVVSGSGTTFTGAAKVDFGAGITVSNVRVVSPTSLAMKVKIAPTAALGLRDVMVDGQKLEKAFAVQPAISVLPVGKVEQGGVAQVAIQNNDLANPFDKDNFKVDAPELVDFGVSAESNLFAGGAVLVPPLAAASAALTVANVDSKGASRTTFIGDPNDLKVTPRAPGAITANAAAAPLALGADLASFFGKLTVPMGSAYIVDYRMEVPLPAAGAAATTPLAALFGKGGKAKDLLDTAAPPQGFFGPEDPPYDIHLVYPMVSSTAAEEQYLVMVNTAGRAGSTTFSTGLIKASQVAEDAAAHNTAATAQTLTALEPMPVNLANDVGGKVLTGALAAATEVDIYKLTVVANDTIQVAIAGEGEYDVVTSRNGTLDPEAAATLGYAYSSTKGRGGNATFSVKNNTTIYIAVTPYQGRFGKYTMSVRKVPALPPPPP
ncbi:MAG: hypothetical protein IPQ09_15040 [Myxococcales bacterium]|nr:hypothetical protein [Myxococcales bacterium]